MYVDSQPASLHVRSAVVAATTAAMLNSRPQPSYSSPSSQPSSSSSSLRGMEISLQSYPPSFQEFVKRTPPVNQDKPLPRMPYVEALSSLNPPSDRSRRTSSVYSRTVRQSTKAQVPWRSRDLASFEIFLQPSIYSLSTPELVKEEESRQSNVNVFLQSKKYEPLLKSSSPSPSPSLVTPGSEISTISFEEPPIERRVSELLPLSDPGARTSKHSVKTVSLDKSRPMVHASGEASLSKERVQVFAVEKTRKNSFHQIRSLTRLGDMVMSELRSPVSPTSTIHGDWWREKQADTPTQIIAQPLPWANPTIVKFQLRESKLSDKSFGMDSIDRAEMAPMVLQQQPFRTSSILVDEWGERATQDASNEATSDHCSWDCEEQSRSVEQDYEDRGSFFRTSAAATSSDPTVISPNRRLKVETTSNAAVISEAERLAREYQDILPEREYQPGAETRDAYIDSREVKMTPRPLFFNPRQISKQRTEQYNRQRNGSRLLASSSPLVRKHEYPGANGGRWYNPSPAPGYPLKLRLTPELVGSHGISGTIPISPPVGIRLPRSGSPCHKPSKKASSPSLFAQVISTAASSSIQAKGYRQRKSVDGDSPSSVYTPATSNKAYSNGSTPKAPKQRLSYSATSSQPLPSHLHKGATVVATRAEAEAAFNIAESLIIPIGPVLPPSPPSSRGTITAEPRRQSSATPGSSHHVHILPNLESLVTLGNHGSSGSSVRNSSSHKHRASNSSGGSGSTGDSTTTLTGKSPLLANVSGRVANVLFHRRSSVNGGGGGGSGRGFVYGHGHEDEGAGLFVMTAAGREKGEEEEKGEGTGERGGGREERRFFIIPEPFAEITSASPTSDPESATVNGTDGPSILSGTIGWEKQREKEKEIRKQGQNQEQSHRHHHHLLLLPNIFSTVATTISRTKEKGKEKGREKKNKTKRKDGKKAEKRRQELKQSIRLVKTGSVGLVPLMPVFPSEVQETGKKEEVREKGRGKGKEKGEEDGDGSGTGEASSTYGWL